MVSLQSERLSIRAFKETDWQGLYEYLSDEAVVTFEPYEVYDEEQAQQEARRRVGDSCFYAVCLKESGKLIGNLYLAPTEFETWELGYIFNATYQTKGYATEAATELIHYAFETLKARRIIAMCNPKNERSWKLLERLGMRYEGCLLQNIFFKRDQENQPIWQDTYEYAILKDEWILKSRR